ncbi:MAG TPA: hypothetical protein EYQ24_10460 [Bacteroidetes bacterium]|nr:hypothetical protein [Bacteroidota bacterium]
MQVLDRHIRSALKESVIPRFTHQGDLVVDEMGVCRGDARVDVAVVNTALHGFEIKSERDTLARLPRQVELYGRVLDYASLVAAQGHANRAKAIIPPWWAVWTAEWSREGVRLTLEQEGARNPNVDSFSLAMLLWKSELAHLFETVFGEVPARRATRPLLAREIAKYLQPEELGSAVRAQLKVRQGWRGHVVPE